MMRIACLPVLLFAISAVGQAVENVTPKQATTPASTAPSSPDAKLSAATPVMVIKGLCEKKDADPKGRVACSTVITRAEFDALADAIQPHMTEMAKAQLAASYPRLLLMEHEFKALQLENDARVKRALEYEKLRAEGEQAEKAIKAKASVVGDMELQKYYTDNQASFQEAELLRIYVPFPHEQKQHIVARRVDADPTKPEDTGRPANDPLRAIAEALRLRAVAGENFDNLQADAYREAGVSAPALETNIGKHTATEMSDDHKQLVAMQVGEVSQVMTGPNGYYLYKVVSKNVRPLDQVRNEISTTLGQQKFADLSQKIDRSVKTEFNAAYFQTNPATVTPASATSRTPGLASAGMGAPGRRNTRFPTIPALQIAPQTQTASPAPAAASPAPASAAPAAPAPASSESH
jgi:hypothetical protein